MINLKAPSDVESWFPGKAPLDILCYNKEARFLDHAYMNAWGGEPLETSRLWTGLQLLLMEHML